MSGARMAGGRRGMGMRERNVREVFEYCSPCLCILVPLSLHKDHKGSNAI